MTQKFSETWIRENPAEVAVAFANMDTRLANAADTLSASFYEPHQKLGAELTQFRRDLWS